MVSFFGERAFRCIGLCIERGLIFARRNRTGQSEKTAHNRFGSIGWSLCATEK